MSCDDKCKIPIGIPAVHRLNSINHKFFLSDSQPNYPDYDTLRSGSLINPQGYMILKSSSSEASQQSENRDTEPADRVESPTEDAHLSHRSPGPTVEDIFEDIFEDDFDQRTVPLFFPTYLNLSDEIDQLDGANDPSSGSEDEFGEDDMNVFRSAGPMRKIARIESEDEYSSNTDESENEHNQDVDESEEENEVIPQQQEDQEDEGQLVTVSDFPEAKYVMKDGRNHVSIPHTGNVYIFFKSPQAKPSSISRHINDILTIAEVEPCLKEKPKLLLLLDDGLDWGGRGLQTLFYLGDLWRRLDLDLLVISRNALVIPNTIQ